MLREQLIQKAKSLGVKGIYRMRKTDLEWAIYLKESVSWFNDIAGNTITISDEEVDISLNEIDLKGESPLTEFKMKDIDKHKQLWLIS
tara:strand:- start:171 stop:434 length:264 start_codon:yes stop_codon:yes gene_type:complete